ncbi:MAG: cellulase family glycosylhydrolase [Cytophagales bacterium]|nr:cellulase family glycosylhydrolase [Cytophagales bacterium]MCA6369661.1 cellulase family glycosylhydrolase [Cytophagales bacterium]MCA6373752.1 cellulase family glycosylhydrolase [Cytophagales bacterium]MCA6377863.1 cellulase family glycosylhydrolase [Cytophagales bacterium]MCA6386230.1 cellulase family glycosylhydrolase [Cytophagales bacterium]
MRKIVAAICLLFGCQNSDSVKTTNELGIPISIGQAKIALDKGINLSGWFTDFSDPSLYASRFSADDLKRIKSSGFSHIRLPIATSLLFQENSPSVLNQQNLLFIDNAVKKAIGAGLAVLIDPIHNYDGGFEKKLATTSGFDDKVVAYWQAIAKAFSTYATDKVFFEVYNEPHAASGTVSGLSKSWWWPVQLKFVQAIRKITRNHFIVVGAEGWNNRFDLMNEKPYAEENIVYNFHFYDPFLFTHQGADWTGWLPAQQASNVPYPSSPAAVAALVSATSQQELKDILSWHGNQKYNYDSLLKWVKPVADWGKRNNVVVTCNEFGSYKLKSPRQSRLNWIGDMRKALEANNIPWAMWECDEGFGWIDYPNNDRSKPIVDNEVLIALGLK